MTLGEHGCLLRWSSIRRYVEIVPSFRWFIRFATGDLLVTSMNGCPTCYKVSNAKSLHSWSHQCSTYFLIFFQCSNSDSEYNDSPVITHNAHSLSLSRHRTKKKMPSPTLKLKKIRTTKQKVPYPAKTHQMRKVQCHPI